VKNDDGEVFVCQTRRHSCQPCVGDRVKWQPSDPGHGLIVEILPRRTLLARPGRRGRPRAVAANLDQVAIVIAREPSYDLLLVDQYLVVCENHQLEPAILLNKTDLLDTTIRKMVLQDLTPYRQLYPLLMVSARNGEGMEELGTLLRGKTSMFAGQSGVGKSSLLKSLIPDREVRIGGLSANTRRGRHTTTTALLFHLQDGEKLIDTPGVAVFGLAGIDTRKLAYGYREFRPFMERCRFNDCRHAGDLGCAVTEGVETGKIHPARYQRYLKLLDKLPRIS